MIDATLCKEEGPNSKNYHCRFSHVLQLVGENVRNPVSLQIQEEKKILFPV